MAPFRSLLTDLTDERFRVAIGLGVASIPFTIWANWYAVSNGVLRGSDVSFLFVACVISGYFYRSREVNSARAGEIAGLSGGVPVLIWQSATFIIALSSYPPFVDAIGNATLVTALSVAVGLVTVPILAAVLLLVGWVGGRVGQWLNGQVGSVRSVESNG
ncbi:hypothetical protein AUR64_18630 [Haloprofundus marisrubri]|uniref:Uncharacterized protein n=1 Tax=Haloprofundus marisrubri TaxID=1514971 RepID=A0A0W1R5X8_9EURY|nr:DUF5518 domain-containing protein [Haloprofundus marisrubri]KTG08682.1 hypothetical protein AUR64_18630 [Haloprofundus marisrubri]